MNKVLFHRPKLKDLLKIKSGLDFQSFLVNQAVIQYTKICKAKGEKLGSVLSIGANQTDAKNLPKFPFEKITLSNIVDVDKATKEAIDKNDSRISYVKKNLEGLDIESESYDLVFCKETLHHIPRPSLGVYEILRVCKKAAIMIEPYETFLGNILEKFNLSSTYERDFEGKSVHRECYVYRWNKKELVKLLNSYYLESGYNLHITNFWLSNRSIGGLHIAKSSLSKILGWIISFLPFNRGNFMIALIVPGNSLPPEIKKV
ncbi:MAG: class I SAM-dependent methyltransferase [Nanoarchaeota archaeon]|nr:class I SAM-dependent methyltransferase [Nanoarchaeota archaeon]